MLLTKSLYKLEAELWDEEDEIMRSSMIKNTKYTLKPNEEENRRMMVDVLEPEDIDDIDDIEATMGVHHRGNASSAAGEMVI